jgi:RNA polymerase sigma-70 factor (ECF subfamily)
LPVSGSDGAAGDSGPQARSLPDDDLLERLANAEPAAFAQLVELHFQPVYRVAWRMLGGGDGAEDVAQEAFLRLWQNPRQVRDGKALKSWLMRVASNLVVDRYRRQGPVDAGELPDAADDAPGPELALRRTNVAAAIDRAIAGLPERQRLALVLSHYEGYGNPEIALALDVSVEAVESLLARARRGLKGLLADRWQELLDDVASF